MKVFQFITEALAWLQIAASPFIAAVILGGTVYLIKRNTLGLCIGIGITLVGLVVGSIWATKIWRKQGTVNFMSRLISNPELNKESEKE